MRGRPTLTNPHIPTGRRGYVGGAKRTATKRFDRIDDLRSAGHPPGTGRSRNLLCLCRAC